MTPTAKTPHLPAVVWQDCECGTYAADLGLWQALAREAAGPVLDLGAGTGRVALSLARAGFDVTAVDSEPELLAELERRSGREASVATLVANVRELSPAGCFALILAPMQLVHLLGGPAGRAAMLRAAASGLAVRGRVAVALLAEPAAGADAEGPPVPDVVERDGWVYSSLPIEVRALDGAVEVRRLRQVVSPSGELTEEVDATRLDAVDPDAFEAEAAAAGLQAAGRREIRPTGDHVGSTVVLLEHAGDAPAERGGN